jgi:hypothetical protein
MIVKNNHVPETVSKIQWNGGCFVEFFEAKFNTLVQQ